MGDVNLEGGHGGTLDAYALSGRGVGIPGDDRNTLGRETPADRRSDATTGSGDDRDLALRVHLR
jgi:hypothetical protein